MDAELRRLCDEYLAVERHPEFRKEILDLMDADDEEDIRDRFYTQLAFGTGGLRGVIGGGYNRVNPYMVRRATQGLANYIEGQRLTDPSVVIAYDCRRYSELFAEEAALVLAYNGIKAYLFSSLRPTPELSFAVRQLGAAAGIVITASHNPSSYNGYKVYWSDGAQVVPPHDEGILKEVRNITGDIPVLGLASASAKGLLEMVDSAIDDSFINMIAGQVIKADLVRDKGHKIKVVYTPLHGAGRASVETILTKMGVDYLTVPEQREPDGAFPTVESPNPEEGKALQMAISLAKKVGASLVMGTDPDSDRLGIAVQSGDEYQLLTGNQLGALLCDYIFCARSKLGTLPKAPVMVKTIVTTELQRKIAESYGAKVYDVLTGFKYIGEKIRQFEKTDEEYIFGGEESYGYLIGTEIRDKDAVSAAAMTVEMALHNVSRGWSVLDHLDDIYRRFGYYRETLISKTFTGEQGRKKIDELMERLRKTAPVQIGGQAIVEVRDYQSGIVSVPEGSAVGHIDLPKSNVLQFYLEHGVFSVRPSGTEPKIKYYGSCWSERDMPLGAAKIFVESLIDELEQAVDELS